ncbi:hypothetical protein Tco_1321238 [Tanacetum coccineum]
MLESETYKTYHAYATGEKIPKPKYVQKKADSDTSPKKKPIALSEDAQIKIATKRSKTQFHSSHVSGSGADEGSGVIPGVPDVPTYESEDERISWKSSEEDDDDEVNRSEDDDDQHDDNDDNASDNDQDDDNDQTESNNDNDDFAHPKLSTFDEKERQDKEDKEEKWSDDEAYDEETQGVNVEGEELDEDEINEDDKVNELYRDMNIHLEGRDTKMTDAPQTNVQGTQVTEDTHVIITAATLNVQQQSSSVSLGFISNMLNPNPNIGIDSILNLNTESTSLVDVPCKSFRRRLLGIQAKNPFVEVVSLILGIIDTYLANKLNEAVKTVVQLQSNRLRDEAQAKNEDFIHKLDENIKKIIKEQVKVQVKENVSKILPRIEKFINEHLEAEVLTRSSNEAKTSHV